MVAARWLGEDKVVTLRDDGGGGPADQPADGVYVGSLRGPRPSLLPLRLAPDAALAQRVGAHEQFGVTAGTMRVLQ